MTTIEVDREIWTGFGDVWVHGHAYYEDRYVNSTEMVSLIKDIDCNNELASFLSDLNGFYGVVVDTDEETILAADRMRSCPLFYSIVDGNIIISDNTRGVIKSSEPLSRSEVSEIEYETARFVTGSNTLYDGIYQLQSEEMVIFDKTKSQISRDQYHVHTVTKDQYSSEQLKAEFQRVLDAVFDRLVEIAGGRPIAVPLSGGYDSRLIAIMLKRVEYENVITYSVNTGENIAIAEDVAESLGFPWVTADLTHSDWKDFYNSDDWDRYFDHAGSVGSLPNPTQIPALNKLIDDGAIPANALFTPGDSALDTMKATPMRLEHENDINEKSLTSYIIDQHFKYNERTAVPREQLVERVIETTGLRSSSAPKSPVEAFERWRLKERRAKLIINGVRAFDFFGYDWWIPLEDQELYEFWRRVPLEYKRHRSFYEAFIEDLYVEVGDVDAATASTIAGSNLKSTIADHVRDQPVWPYVKRAYATWDKSRLKYEYMKRFRLNEIYESDPRFGIMSKATLQEMYEGQSFPFFSLLAQSMDSKINLDK